jgi:hypothetical protein
MTQKIAESIDLPDGRIVLFRDDDDTSYRFENLVCFDIDGSLRWKAALPKNSGSDCFTSVAFDGEHIRAYAWSGFLVWFDPLTDSAVRTVFTK